MPAHSQPMRLSGCCATINPHSMPKPTFDMNTGIHTHLSIPGKAGAHTVFISKIKGK
jgi:glutamine synthetase